VLLFLHKKVKMFFRLFLATSNFEVLLTDIVITTVANRFAMESDKMLKNIEEKHSLDRATAEQLARIMASLFNIED
jgi:hypothetical protein